MQKILVLCALVAFAAAQCSNIKYLTSEGAGPCDFTSNLCKSELFCNAVTQKCQFTKVIGDSCTLDLECVNTYTTAVCSQGKCAVANKNAGASCNINSECASASCVSGVCASSSVGSSCKTTGFCGSPSNDLYCSEGTCAAVATSGNACGYVNSGKPFVQCTPGLYCVNSDTTKTTGTCQSGASESSTCGTTNAAGVYSAPSCSSSGRALFCVLGKCTGIILTPVGSKCDAATTLQGFGCDVATSTCIDGTCKAYSSLTCNKATDCGAGIGQCICSGSSTTSGTCQASPYLAPLTSCLGSSLRVVECTNTANGQNPQTVCADKFKNLRCCGRDNIVANKDLNLAYCSSATLTQISVVLAVIVAVLAF